MFTFFKNLREFQKAVSEYRAESKRIKQDLESKGLRKYFEEKNANQTHWRPGVGVN